MVWARAFIPRTALVAESIGGGADIAPARFVLLDAFETAYGANLIGCTIMAVRGYMACPSPSNALEDVHVRAGLKITDDATAPPATTQSLFNAVANTGGAHDDWFGFFPMYAPLSATNVAGGIEGGGLQAVRVDVRSRRRLSELGQALVLDVSARSTAGADIAFTADLSVLVALP